ncbi:magnesium and cobalt transport protein CorA [Peribacillus deserti]|uniref:Magnesium transport protein CorA n=2 Tax=Peribacillus deserti TaxID=673318 RepID=A0A2N5M3P6_9BACI|nr:magnesium and cobalt transport protein CorA [Peribacillus deserti]
MFVIRTLAITNDGEILHQLRLEEMDREDIKWFWVDFDRASREETLLLGSIFHFHPLSVEDCLDDFLQRPKLDFYDDYQFIVVHALDHTTLEAEEVDMFISSKHIVTYHKKPLPELDKIWESFNPSSHNIRGPFFVIHSVIDKIVDNFFPLMFKIEDFLNELDDHPSRSTRTNLMEELFDVRGDLNKIRKTLIPMRDLLYRIINSERLSHVKDQKLYFNDIYDHLLKLVEMMETSREFSSDIRDSYISMNSHIMNTVIMTLTVITTIFMPLTFIVGIYGMNFEHMPELEWKYGYFLVLMVMFILGFGMFLYFNKKGWIGKPGKIRVRQYTSKQTRR